MPLHVAIKRQSLAGLNMSRAANSVDCHDKNVVSRDMLSF